MDHARDHLNEHAWGNPFLLLVALYMERARQCCTQIYLRLWNFCVLLARHFEFTKSPHESLPAAYDYYLVQLTFSQTS